MNRVKIKEGLIFSLPKELKKILQIGSYLTVDVEDKRRIILEPALKESIVLKTAGILRGKVTEGTSFENRIRKQAEKQLKLEEIE